MRSYETWNIGQQKIRQAYQNRHIVAPSELKNINNAI